MFVRATRRKKNGKWHRYYSVVENRRLANGSVTQRQVLYLGEINDSQEAAWRKTIAVFDGLPSRVEELALFPDDRPVPPDALNAVQIQLARMKLLRPRPFGDCWLACRVWEELGLEDFWAKRLACCRGGVPWEKVLRLLAVNRLIEPGSEFRVHRHWFLNSGMDELLGVDFAVASKDRLYRCLDLLVAHKDALFAHLRRRWEDLFAARFDVLLYDLTSTYFEGLCEQIPKARFGYSRDARPDCRQVVLALVVTPDGLPLAYEVLPGNTSDRTTLRGFLDHVAARYGKANRIWVMDRGIPTEAVLGQMRSEGVSYLVGTPKGRLSHVERAFLEKPWREVHAGLAVKLLEERGEALVLAKSAARRAKEQAMRRQKLKRYFHGLLALRRRKKLTRENLLLRLGALRSHAGRAASLVRVRVPREGEAIARRTFSWTLDAERFKAAEGRDGHYILRTNLVGETPEELWTKYVQLTHVEEAFKCLKSDLAVRPIFHHLGHRVDAHIFVAFLAYALAATLRKRLAVHAPGLTVRATLEKLAGILMVEVCFPTNDGRTLVMPRYTEPNSDQELILHKLKLTLPAQPPPRISTGQLVPSV